MDSGEPSLYRFIASVDEHADTRERLEVALRAYLRSPTKEQQDRGYIPTLPTPVANLLDGLSVEGEMTTIDFAPELADRMAHTGGSSASLAFVDEIKATIFQFEQLQVIRIQLDGNCDDFWRLHEMSCQLLARE
jgi:hypothetical protein